MGHTLEEWTAKVASLIRDDVGQDLGSLDIETVGVRPALSEHFHTSPRLAVEDVTGDGTQYLPVPASWVNDESTLLSVEYPLGRIAPAVYTCGFSEVRDATVIATRKILFWSTVPAGVKARLTFLGSWPMPDANPDTDQISNVDYEAVAHLAASYCCSSMATRSARGRPGTVPTNMGDGTSRAASLLAAAAEHRNLYKSMQVSGPLLL